MAKGKEEPSKKDTKNEKNERTNPKYTSEQLSKDAFKKIKEKIYCINTVNEIETQPIMQNFVNILKDINSSPDFKSFFYKDEDALNFKNDFIQTTINYLFLAN